MPTTKKPAPVATTLVELALATGIKLFHTSDSEPFAIVPVATHLETWPVRSAGFRQWLRQRYFQHASATANAQATDDALGTLEGLALFQNEESAVYLRLAEADGAVYLDLGDAEWRTVRIAPGEWSVLEEAPVRFRRPRGLQALPLPIRGGTLDALRELVTLDDDAWRLVVGWLVGTMRPDRPFPVLAVHGEPGAAKTTLAKMLRRLLDPNVADLRPCPRDEYDMILAAKNGWIVGFDNMSVIKPWLSDVLCRVATGIGFGRRQLYTDGDEYLLAVKRPIVLNGIEDVAVRGDLVDRAIVVTLPRIADDRRREEDEIWSAFAILHPRLLGALLDVTAGALERLPTVHLHRLPLMADFARWVTAAEPALGWPPGTFLHSYRRNRGRAVATALEGSLLVEPLRAVLRQLTGCYEGTVGELLRLVRDAAGDRARDVEFPKDPIRLSGELRRLAPALRRNGIYVRFRKRTKGGRRVRVWERGRQPSTSTTSAGPNGGARAGRGVDDVDDVDEPHTLSCEGSPAAAPAPPPVDGHPRRIKL